MQKAGAEVAGGQVATATAAEGLNYGDRAPVTTTRSVSWSTARSRRREMLMKPMAVMPELDSILMVEEKESSGSGSAGLYEVSVATSGLTLP
jgi:hypothetical protein